MPGSRSALSAADVENALGFSPEPAVNWRGPWDADETYSRDDGVALSGHSFRARRASEGVAPVIGEGGPETSTYWQYLPNRSGGDSFARQLMTQSLGL